MENIPESPESKLSETRNVLQEFGEKIAQALEAEKKKLREQAETEAKQIVSRAREEASQFMAQARQESKTEAEHFFERIQAQAEQILNEAREKAFTEARRESDKIINETKEKTAQIISDVVKNGITQFNTEFSRVTADAKNKMTDETSRLFMVTKNLERIIDETQTNIQAGIDRLVNIISETGEKLETLNHDQSNKGNSSYAPETAEEVIEIEHIETPAKQKIDVNLPQAQKKVEIEHVETPIKQETAGNPPQATEKTVDTGHIETAIKQETPVNPVWATRKTLEATRKEMSKKPENIANLFRPAGKVTLAPAEKPEEQKVKTIQSQASTGANAAEKSENFFDIDRLLQEGINLLDQGKVEQSLAILKKITDVDPRNALAWRKLGTALGMQGRHLEALKALRKATELTPKDITAWHNTEIILRKLGQKKEAKEAKEKEKQLIKEYPEQFKEVIKKGK